MGVFWSVESAFFVSAVLGPFVLYHLFFNPIKSFNHVKHLVIKPLLSIVITIFLVSLFYIWRLGHLPDYYTFIEEAVGNVEGYFSVLFTINSPLWVHVIILSWLLSQMNNEKHIHLLFSIWVGIWAVSSYSIGQSVGIGLIKLLPIYIFGLFLSFILMGNKNEKKLIFMFIPVFVVILAITFGNPKIVRHFYQTITNQEYTLTNVFYNEIDDFHEILSIIEPGQTPVAYFDETRYLNFLSKRQYHDVDTKKKVLITNKIWLPLHPASLIEGFSLERKIEYINRWLERHPVDSGWVVNPKDHWAHSNYEIAIKEALASSYAVKKHVEHGVLKAVLYEKIY